jgi:scyllo-inositol 2-dehydrogenase (NADP+)
MRDIAVGLIGYGIAGSVFHAPLIRACPQLRLAAVVTSRKERVEALGGVRAVATVAELLSDPEIQLVVVASPSDTHFELACAALAAGKHVVVDKPFTLTAAEAEELIHRAAKSGCALSVYQSRRWDGDYLTVKRLMAEGALGTVYYYEARYDRFRPQIRARWRELPGPGSGILYDLGPHLIDQVLQLFGMPRVVSADAFAQRPGGQSIDYFHLMLDYGPMRAVLHSSVLAPGPGPHFSIHGDGGSFIKYGMDPQEEALKAGQRPGDAGWGEDDPSLYGELTSADGRQRRVETEHGCLENFYREMADHILRGAAVPVDPSGARDNIAVIEAAFRSTEEGRAVRIGRPGASR